MLLAHLEHPPPWSTKVKAMLWGDCNPEGMAQVFLYGDPKRWAQTSPVSLASPRTPCGDAQHRYRRRDYVLTLQYITA